jgi:toxin FitB
LQVHADGSKLMCLLHTNGVSELRKPKPQGAVLAWIEGLDDTQLHLSAVTMSEILRTQDVAKATEIEVG